MLSMILTQVRATWKRTIAIVIAVVIGVAFMTASLLSGNLVEAQLGNQIGNSVRGADIVVTTQGLELTDEVVQLIETVDGVNQADQMDVASGYLDAGGSRSYFTLGRISDLPDVRDGIRLIDGRLPETAEEVVLSESVSDVLSVTVGDDVFWEPYDDYVGSEEQFTVVGVFKGGPSVALNAADGLLAQDAFAATVSDHTSAAILVDVDSNADLQAVEAAMRSVLPDDVTVEQFGAFVDRAVEVYSSGALQIQILTGVFALIAMFAAGIVISNTFQITVTQRVRELAILRCVGAMAGQVKRSVLMEALLIGLVASSLGVLAGIGLVAVANTFAFDAGDRAASLGITPIAVLVPISIGTIVTVVAALSPAGRATRVHPLQAIRHSEAPVETQRMGRIRIIASVVVNLAGIALLLLGLWISRRFGLESGVGLLVGVLGGMISFIGVLISARLVIPPVLTLLGRVATWLSGITGDLATTNLRRNPGRTSSTSAALLMGVTLVTMCVVGVATMKQTFIEFFEERAAIDLEFSVIPEGDKPAVMSDSMREGIAGVDGVSTVAPIFQSRLTLDLGDGSTIETDGVGIDPGQALEVSRADGIRVLSDDVLMVSEFDAEYFGLRPGEAITLTGAGGQREVTVVVEGILGDSVIVSDATMQAVTGNDVPSGVWVRIDDGASVRDVTGGVEEVLPSDLSLAVDGSAHDREVNLRLMDQILLVAMGLLAAAVLIAVIGVGNTLTLSVLERTRESGMLRALGLTTGQMRRTLAIEGILLALVGAVVGMVAGTLYGWIGALTLFGDSFPVSIGFPSAQMGLIVIVAIVCGLLASVIPAKHAMAVSPVEALSVAE